MDAASCPVNLSQAHFDVITMVLQSMSYRDRFTCALVCKTWAEAATAATRSIRLEGRLQGVSRLQSWLKKDGNQIDVLQLHNRDGPDLSLTALPCPQLQDLLLQGIFWFGQIHISSSVWDDIAAATKLTSVSLESISTAAQQADVVSALTALPDLQHLTWSIMYCGREDVLSDSLLLQQLTQLTALKLHCVTAAALEHLGSLTKLQCLGLTTTEAWDAAGLQELKALTSLELHSTRAGDIPDSVAQLTALQQLDVSRATPTTLNGLQALTGLTKLGVKVLAGLSAESAPLQLPGLQHLQLRGTYDPAMPVMPMSFLARCSQLRVLWLHNFELRGPGSLMASTMLQDLDLSPCSIGAAADASHPSSWQQAFSGPGQLPHLTSLQLTGMQPALQQSDIEHMVACCSSLQVLHLNTLQDISDAALARLCGLTSLHITTASDQQCGALAQLSGLRELVVDDATDVAIARLRQLTALSMLTSLEICRGCALGKASRALQEQMSDFLLGSLLAMENKAHVGQPSDVPARLLEACNLVDAACASSSDTKGAASDPDSGF